MRSLPAEATKDAMGRKVSYFGANALAPGLQVPSCISSSSSDAPMQKPAPSQQQRRARSQSDAVSESAPF